MKRLIIAGAILLVLAAAAPAQTSQQQIVGIETGVVFGYNLDPATQGLGTGQEMAISLSVAENMHAGFAYVQGDAANMPNLSLLRFNYYVAERIGVAVSAGMNGANATGGVGLFASILGRTFEDTLYTGLGIRVEYLVNVATGVEEGLLMAGLSARVGI